MYSRKTLLIAILLATNLRAQITTYPVPIKGTFYLADLNERPTFKLEGPNTNAWLYLYVKLYEDNVLTSTTKVLASELSKETFYASILDTPNTTRKIKLAINFYNNDVEDTIVEFDYKSPSYVTRKISPNNRTRAYSPISIYFEAFGSEYEITKTYEYFTLNAPYSVTTQGRFLFFNDVSYTLETTYKKIPRTIKFYIDYYFKDSGLTYEDNKTVIDIGTIKNGNTYTLRDDYDYYIDKNTGEIQNYESSTTEKEALPLFMPLSAGYDKKIKAEFKIEEVNLNHETYIIRSGLNLESAKFDQDFKNIFTNKFYYRKMTDYLEGVIYNA